MHPRSTFAFAALIFSASGSALACQHAKPVVAIQTTVNEQSPEQVEARVTNPVEKLLSGLPRLTEMNSNTRQGVVNFELQFDGGATERDLAVVKERLGTRRADVAIDVISTEVLLTRACLETWPWNAGPT